jgi:AcrR family transcriptional regulator
MDGGSDNVTRQALAQPAAGRKCADRDVADVVRRRRGAALEDAILSAAYAELSTVGYQAFSVEGVAARARTGKASIYRRWPTKQELVLDALLEVLPTPEQCGIDVDIDTLPDDVSTADMLRQLAHVIAGLLSSPAGDAMRAVKCEAFSDPELARAVDERFQEPRRQALIELLRRGVRRGEVRPGADCALVADVLPAMLAHRVILMREAIAESEITEIIEQVVLPLIEVR